MKKNSKHKSFPVELEAAPDIIELVSKMHQQIISLEKKIDTLIGQSSGRPFEGERHSRPPQRFERSDRPGEMRQDRDFRERTLHKAICAECNKECEVPFKPSQERPVYCRECFSKRKASNPFASSDRDNRHRGRDNPQEYRFDKHHGAGSRRPIEKRKPIHKKRKRGGI